jgi:hypothetical protein
VQEQRFSSQQSDLSLPMCFASLQRVPVQQALTTNTPILTFSMALRRAAFLTENHLVARWEIVSECGSMRVLGDATQPVYRAYCGTNCAQSHSLTKLANEILRVYPEFWGHSWNILTEVSWTSIDQAHDGRSRYSQATGDGD